MATIAFVNASDTADFALDLNRYLIQHPAATFFVRVSGNSMKDAGIHDNDILIVDRAVPPVSSAVVLAVVAGEFVIKKYSDLLAHPETEFEMWGVITYSLHKV